MGREARPGRIVLPGDRPSRSIKGRVSFPKKDALFGKIHLGEPCPGVLIDLPLKEGGSVCVLLPPDQAKSFAVQIYKCVIAITGEKIDAGFSSPSP